MTRELVVVTVALVAVALAAEACAAPAGEVAPDYPIAQATNVRRTAVAEVQRIIANNPPATPLPSATPTPVPTCQNAIWWSEARSHVGESRTVQGTIVATRPAPGGSAVLELGQPYPDPSGLAVVIPSTGTTDLSGKTVCVTGKILKEEGNLAIQLRDSRQIVVLDAGP